MAPSIRLGASASPRVRGANTGLVSRARARQVVSAKSLGEGDGKTDWKNASIVESLEELGKAVTGFFDYESWAPRSARAWRLGEVPTEAQTKAEPDEMDLLVSELQRLSRDDGVADFDETFEEGGLSGTMLKEMLIYKYGVQYDMNFKVVSLPMKRVLSLNIMWSYVGQKSFPYKEDQYLLKLEGIAQTVKQLGMEKKVREFFAKEPKPERGLPAYPTVGTAVIIRMPEVEDSIVNEFFPQANGGM